MMTITLSILLIISFAYIYELRERNKILATTNSNVIFKNEELENDCRYYSRKNGQLHDEIRDLKKKNFHFAQLRYEEVTSKRNK